MNFYSVIIGSELLNGRRRDSHFDFLNKELIKRGWEQKGSFVIKDDFKLIEDIFNLIKSDEKSVMFSFGGIGSTPDDITRAVSAEVFGDGKLHIHDEVFKIIIDKFGDEAYPHRIKMSELPKDADLLKNVVNNIPGFQMKNRFFFTPGFPSMAQSMVVEALDNFYPQHKAKFREGFLAQSSENEFINLMNEVPPSIELSSLPSMVGEKREVEISLLGESKDEVLKELNRFINYMNEKKINFTNKGK